jgi:hypothetical protein
LSHPINELRDWIADRIHMLVPEHAYDEVKRCADKIVGHVFLVHDENCGYKKRLDTTTDRTTLLEQSLFLLYKIVECDGDALYRARVLLDELGVDGSNEGGVTVNGQPLTIPFDNPIKDGALIYREPERLVRVADVAAMNIVEGAVPPGRPFHEAKPKMTRVVLKGGNEIFCTEAAFAAISNLMTLLDDGS